MAYEANREDSKEAEKQRNDQNNARNIQNAAEVATASGHPVAAAIGEGVKTGDKLTGGKVSELGGKAMTTANKLSPLGGAVQDASNRLSESGISDVVGKAASKKNQTSDGKTSENVPNQAANNRGQNVSQNSQFGNNSSQIVNSNGEQGFPQKKGNNYNQVNRGGEQNSPPTSQDKNDSKSNSNEEKTKDSNKDSSETKQKSSESEEKSKSKGLINAFLALGIINTILILFLPVIFIILIISTVLSTVSGIIGDFADAIGISQKIGEDTGGIEFETTDKEQEAFYDRVDEVIKKLEQDGKLVEALKITSVFHSLMNHNANLKYEDFTISRIEEVALSMYDEDGVYSDDTFHDNLVQKIIPKYVQKTTEEERKEIVKEILEYVENYYDLIGKKKEEICSNESGTCSYNINKGYYFYDLTSKQLKGQGYVSEKIQPSDIQVRLIGCDGKALDGEDLVPFEKFVLGVSYGSLSNPTEASFKAETVGVRSYMLGIHKSSNVVTKGSTSNKIRSSSKEDWRTLKKENNKWIMQASACTNEKLTYCNPDVGCSSDSSGNIHSGTTYTGSYKKSALSKTSSLRTYALETEGEVLKNSKGYIAVVPIYNLSLSTYADKGYDYKQILLTIYKDDNLTISKNSCKNSLNSSQCVSTGEFSSWKQKGASWSNITLGSSGKNIGEIGCLVTSVAMQIAKSKVETKIANFNPGTFVQFLNKNGGFDSGGNFQWNAATKAAPSFKYVGKVDILGLSESQKLAKIKELVGNKGIYVVAEVKGNTGQHWVAIDSVVGNTIHMMDPGSKATNMWSQYNPKNTSILAYYRVS